MSGTSCADPPCGSPWPRRLPRPARPRAPPRWTAVPAWRCRSLTALLSHQRAETVDGLDQEPPDHRLVGRVQVAECVVPLRADQHDRFLHLLPPGTGQVQPDNTAVGGLPAGLHLPTPGPGGPAPGPRARGPETPPPQPPCV